jgi:hypothetical protein
MNAETGVSRSPDMSKGGFNAGTPYRVPQNQPPIAENPSRDYRRWVFA